MTEGQYRSNSRRQLQVAGKTYDYFSLAALAETGLGGIDRLPFSLKVLLENLLRHEDGRTVSSDDVACLAEWAKTGKSDREIAYRPARVLMQDFTGVPAVVDLAAMRDAMVGLGGDPEKINPVSPVDLVIDHSVMVDSFGTASAFQHNVDLEFQRNGERYEFLRWGAEAFRNFRVVPPGTGICHQVNLEYLAQTVWTQDVDGATIAYPDTLVGTDSHTTMVNGMAVLGWGVGGIEAQAAMLGQPVSMLIPDVVGFRLTGKHPEGTTATDLVLTVVQMLRAKGVVGKFVEFYGPGLDQLSLADRATIANMAPEYGATCGFFPIDEETIKYLAFTGRDDDRVALVEAYAKAQGMWRSADAPDPVFNDTISLDLSTVEPSLAGPKQPHDRVLLKDASRSFAGTLQDLAGRSPQTFDIVGADFELADGAIVIAAITSCTNTSNPAVLFAAGLVARNAVAKGLKVKPWVKTSLAPGSQVVTEYLFAAGLQDDLDMLGFNLVGYGCMTCIGNSGLVNDAVMAAIEDNGLFAASVLSGNRNFEGRVNPLSRANYLASPPLVVAYAIAGNMNIDITRDALGEDRDGNPVYLRDIWPSNREVEETILGNLSPEMYRVRYANVFDGSNAWQAVPASGGVTYNWNDRSTYVQTPPYFEGMSMEIGDIEDIQGARELAVLGDSITTDHISPAGNIAKASPAGDYLLERQIRPEDFNSYGARRGNHQVMMRGTFANVRLRNEMLDNVTGGQTKHIPSGDQMSIYDAAMRYQDEGVPLVVIGGKEYGTGSSRDWAAKGTRLLGVKAVIVESFERIHRSNLVGMGVLPLQFKGGENRETLGLTGNESFDLSGLKDGLKPSMDVHCKITFADSSSKNITLLCRIDTTDEVDYYRNGGILQYVLRNLATAA